MIISIFVIVKLIVISESSKITKFNQSREPLREMIDMIVEEMSAQSKCIVFILDPFYRRLINYNGKRDITPYYTIYVRENEEFSPPRPRVDAILTQSKVSGCDIYVILIANGLQVIDLLKYVEKERLINNHGHFLLMHDNRLFNREFKYLWNRIVNVLFIRRFSALKQRSGEIINNEWFNLETIEYPVRNKGNVITHYIDTWYKGKFRYGNNHYLNKTSDLKNKKLNVAIFEHIPAVTRKSELFYKNWKATTNEALGIEFEILRAIAGKMNFKPIFYRPHNVENEKWGSVDENETYNGLLGESINGNAAFLLGDLHYTLRHYKLLDLSLPYNTECLTFLTPESLTQNSWKFLIVPFTLYTWIAVILILFFAAITLRLFALFYEKKISPFKRTVRVSSVKNLVKRVEYLPKTKIDEQLKGLTLFTEVQNSLLYTYGMLLQVSLPRLPRAWAVRVFIGWWWLYTILVTVAYRSSMTAVLAHPVARITIDTVEELAKSVITVGGWGEDKKELFLSTPDEYLNKIGNKFELINNESEAIARVANGTFAYYENIYVLRDTRAKRQILEAMEKLKATKSNEKITIDRDLHIMQECVINMPISIGMDRNSPLKPRVDKIIRRIVESGLLQKWLNDVMEWSKIAEIKNDSDMTKALVDLKKLHGALVALAIGYFLSFVALGGEILYWRYIIMKHPAYDKYQMDVFYAMMKEKKGKC